MKNLELKVKIDENYDKSPLNKYYHEYCNQIDEYYICKNGRFKIRTEYTAFSKTHRAIYYTRPNIENAKESIYYIYEIQEYDTFLDVFNEILNKEIEIRKTRIIYIYKNSRIHIDHVNNLGDFLEIEIIIETKEDDDNKNILLEELIDLCNIRNNKKINVGYRELMMQINNQNKDLEYYKNTNKVFWYVNKDIPNYFKMNDITPCIFIQIKDNKKLILQFDESIKLDSYKYTAWRKFIGQQYDIYVDVLLIYENYLITLNGDKINFDDLGRSSVIIDKEYLAKFDMIN